MNSKKGFTLVELIVVMSIMGILGTMGFSAYTNSINKSKDARRKADLRSIMTALQLYYNDNGKYPQAGSCGYGQANCFVKSASGGSGVGVGIGGGSSGPWIPALTTSYIKSVPVDPINNGTDPWATSGYTYEYGNVTTDGQSFDLVGQLEWHNDPDICLTKMYLKSGGASSTQWCSSDTPSANYLYQQQVP